MKIPVGRYKGSEMDVIFDEDPAYIDWLEGWIMQQGTTGKFGEKNAQLLTEIRHLKGLNAPIPEPQDTFTPKREVRAPSPVSGPNKGIAGKVGENDPFLSVFRKMDAHFERMIVLLEQVLIWSKALDPNYKPNQPKKPQFIEKTKMDEAQTDPKDIIW